MRYFSEQLVANSRPHAEWWSDVSLNREHFHQVEDHFAALSNSAAVLPRDAWMDIDSITRRVLRDDEGEVYMRDLMALARPINIGKLVSMTRVASGANIDLTSPSTTSDAIDTFFTQTLGAMLDANLITGKVNIYVSPEIGRNLDRSYSGANGFKGGTLLSYLLTNRRINKIEVTFKLSGNEFFGFVPSAEFIRPLIGMAVNTTAMPRLYPTANYQFLKMGALGLEIRADYNGKSGVFYSTNT